MAVALALGHPVRVNSTTGFSPARQMLARSGARRPVASVSLAASRHPASAIADATGSAPLIPAGLGRVLGGSRFTARDTFRGHLLHGSQADFAARALQGGGGSSEEGHLGYPDDEAQTHASSALEVVSLRVRLRMVDLDSLPEAAAEELRSEMEKMGAMDPAVPMHHWVIARFKDRVQSILGDEVYADVVQRDVDWRKLDDTHATLINSASGVISLIKALMAQIKYSILHPYPTKAALPFNHALYDISPAFLKTLSSTAADLYFIIDHLSFTDHHVTQGMDGNHERALLHVQDAIVDFYNVLQPPTTDTVSMKLPAKDCMVGQGETSTERVMAMLGKLAMNIRAQKLRLCA